MRIRLADYVASFIESLGVKDVFLIPGGSCLNLVDAIDKNANLNYVCNHNEQACAMAAESYARVSKNIGVCMVTVGPGVTNTITGIAGAWLDSIPTIYLSGQVKRDDMIVNSGSGVRQLGVQELNSIDLIRPITKYSTVIMEPNDVKYHLQKAAYLALNGRPGPVYLDIPADVQSAIIDENDLKDFDPVKENLVLKSDFLRDKIKDVISLIKKSKKPIIFAGNGIKLSNSNSVFLELISQMNIPVLTSMSAHDLLPSDYDLCIGRPGVFGDRAGNFAVQNADLLISIGVRHHLWNIGYNYKAFAAKAKKIVVDIDENELKKKTVVPDLVICANVKNFMEELSQQMKDINFPDISDWLSRCKNFKKNYPVVLPEYKDEKKYVNSYYFTDVLSSLLDEGEIIVTGVGTSFTGTLQCFKIKKNQSLNSNVGCASMGYDLPAAIGACFANNKKRVVLITGDGSIMMNLQELQTIKHHNLPIKIFLLNNNGYLAIKNSQNAFFDGRLVGTDPSSGVSFPDFEKIALAFDIDYKKIMDHTDMDKIIVEVLASDSPIVCDINMSPIQQLYPKVYSMKNSDGSMESRALEDMYPFLDRDEFISNML